MNDFEYRVNDGMLVISYEGRLVTTLKGGEARQFLERVVGAAEDSASLALALAKATGSRKGDKE